MIPAIGSALPRLDATRIDATGLATSVAPGAGTPTAGSADFATVMRDVAADAVDTLKKGEAVSIQGMNGQATTQSVVDAVMNAERTLQTAVTLRDKVVSAYLEVSRMAI